jgi:UDP-N-acetylmuramyl pentapeptide synthase
MRELGAEEIRYHTELAPLLVGVAGVVLLGPLMQHLLPLLPPAQVWGAYPNPDDFDPQSLVPRVQTGDAVLVKGSKSITYVRKVAQRVAQALQHMPN